jgi:hypothetical protein
MPTTRIPWATVIPIGQSLAPAVLALLIRMQTSGSSLPASGIGMLASGFPMRDTGIPMPTIGSPGDRPHLGRG